MACGTQSATGSRTSLQFGEETCWGQEAASILKGVTGLRSESIVGEIGKLTSEALRPDRAVHKRVQGTKTVGGDIVCEISPDGFVTLFKHAIGKATDASGDGSYWEIRPNGQSDTPPYGLPEGMTFIANRDGKTVATNEGLSGERYFIYTGMKVNSFQLTANPTEILTATFSLLGKGEELSDGSADAPDATFGTDDPLTGFQGALTIDGTASDVLSFGVTVNNNLSADKFYMGMQVRGSLPENQRTVEGTMQVEFKTTALYTKFQNGTSASLNVKFDASPVGSPNTSYLEFLLPRVEFDGHPVTASGNEAIVVEVPFTALWDDGGVEYDVGINIMTQGVAI